MGGPDGRIRWYSPDPRCIFALDAFHVPRSVRKAVRDGGFDVRINADFERVMRLCAERPEGTWISDEIRSVYVRLHRAGFAHSVETWRDSQLVGGLYGVSIGAAFFGESMFHRATNASKVALVALVERLRARSFELLDTQWSTPHLQMFGATDVPREAYLRRLRAAIQRNVTFCDDPPD